MNVEIGTEAAQFPEKEYINGIFFAVEGLPSWPFVTYFFGKYQDKLSVAWIFLKRRQLILFLRLGEGWESRPAATFSLARRITSQAQPGPRVMEQVRSSSVQLFFCKRIASRKQPELVVPQLIRCSHVRRFIVYFTGTARTRWAPQLISCSFFTRGLFHRHANKGPCVMDQLFTSWRIFHGKRPRVRLIRWVAQFSRCSVARELFHRPS